MDTTKLQKTILGEKIKSVQFYRMNVPKLYKERIFGFIWLERGLRVRIENGSYYLINQEDKKEDAILKTSNDYKKIKRMISRWFAHYRNNGICQHVSYWRARAVDGMHNVKLFKLSGISFKDNKSNFLKLAS
ncbi:hypothetical protein [Chryseobacterium potabilaquae]|nr:hypothetical protein [Chryseobacterium potabilaquae]